MNIDKCNLHRMGQLLLLTLGVGVCSIGSAADKVRPPEMIYAEVCGYCHGSNVGPVILGRGLPVSAIKLVVRTGPNAMPAFRPTEISNAELDSLAHWIESSAPNSKEHGK